MINSELCYEPYFFNCQAVPTPLHLILSFLDLWVQQVNHLLRRRGSMYCRLAKYLV